jgi:hypothetical protein
MLATDGTIHRPIVQGLSILFDKTKLRQQDSIDISVALGTQILASVVNYVERTNTVASYHPAFGMVLGGPLLAYEMVKIHRMLSLINAARYPLYVARVNRLCWLGIVEQRFPQLASLGLGRQRWEKLRDAVKPLSKVLSDSLGVPEALFTRVGL